MEKPILFSTSMVQAILNGTKTQTRRVIKPQPYIDESGNFCWKRINFGQNFSGPHIQSIASSIPYRVLGTNKTGIHNPYGKVGDELWVRETFGYSAASNDTPISYWYKATDKKFTGMEGWKPSIHMPRVASRIQLKITDIRVERLQDISMKDAENEGIQLNDDEYGYKCYGPIYGKTYSALEARESFHSLWDSINGKPRKDGQDISWEANPWVWVVEFEQINDNEKDK